MRISETARVYELEKGLILDGVIYHGEVKTKFKYGELSSEKNKNALVHGFTGTENVVEIETVRPVDVAIGDKVQLANGRKGKVTNTSVKLLDDKQLRFVCYDKADKTTCITIKFV